MPSHRRFRVLFIVRPGPTEALCTRYRGYNVMEALRLAGFEVDHLDDRRIPERLEEVRGFDLVVLVRRSWSPEIACLLDIAGRLSIPIICDLDDYLFDEEVIPCSDFLRQMPSEQARSLVEGFRELVVRAGYYTGATDYLMRRAASLGKVSHVVPNGVNLAQLELSRRALQAIRQAPACDETRIGYFSGTLTHQSDFRMIAPVLVRLLGEFPRLTLTVAGDFDLTQFPEFSPFVQRVEKRPFVDWRLLPSEIARADINLIPLLVNAFTEGKSDLKYYEAALVEVPSVASPTEAYRSCIEDGSNGFLAQTEGDWYAALRALVVDPDFRRELGRRAHRHAIEHYAPRVIGSRAMKAYRGILLDHRRRLGVEDDAPTITVLLADLDRAIRHREPSLALCKALAGAGVPVTVQIPHRSGDLTATEALSAIEGHLGAQPRLTVEVGSDVACCDLLLATDVITACHAQQYRHRSSWAAFFVSEYEPAHLSSDEMRAEAGRSHRPGLDLLVVDPRVSEWLDPVGELDVKVLPSWVEAEPLDPDPCPESRTVLLLRTASVPDWACAEASLGLERIGWEHPEVRLLTCGGSPHNTGRIDPRWESISSMSDPAFEAILKDRPICVVPLPGGTPPWIHDLLAKGCPVIAIVAGPDRHPADAEFEQGVLRVPARGHAIAQAIDSLLIDPVRMSLLTTRGAAFARSLPGPGEAARALLDHYHARSRPDFKRHEGRSDPSYRGPRLDVA